MNKYNKEELEELILVQNLSYEEIGRKFNVVGATIKKAARKLGIELPQRRKVNPEETFNKGKKLKEAKFCKGCGVELNSYQERYCSKQCQVNSIYLEYIEN